MHFHFTPTSSLIRDTEALAASLITTYPDIVGVVGIPRSGMLPATVMANCLHVDLAGLDGFLSGFTPFMIPGKRMAFEPFEEKTGTVVLIDDSCGSGKSIKDAVSLLDVAAKELKRVGHFRIVVAAVYSTGDFSFNSKAFGEKLSLHYARQIPKPRIFQWNLFNHADTSHFAFDLDGIFCPDPPCREDGFPNEESNTTYQNYISTAPLIRPLHRRCQAIITSRLSAHLTTTRKWLASKNIRYRHLLTHPARSAAERRKLNNHAAVKAESYKSLSKAWLYVESDMLQAPEIAERSGKPVVCVEDWRIYGGTNI